MRKAHLTDTQGLSRAYETSSGPFHQGGTLYIAGSTSMAHVAEWWKIPANMVKESSIYKKVKEYLRRHSHIRRLVGHSYGGVVALEIESESNKYTATTYGAPVLDLIPRNPYHKPNRYCNYLDPICVSDLGASRQLYVSPFAPNPHSYRNASS